MTQIWIEIEDNENCGYYPIQTFEARSVPETASGVLLNLGGDVESDVVTGWCSERGGSPCDVTVVLVGDSGAGESRLISGGDQGVRIRKAGGATTWSLRAADQRGEPYLLIDSATPYELLPKA